MSADPILNDHYRLYGELLIQAEIVNNRIIEVKKAIAEALSKEANQKEKPSVIEEKA